MYVGPSGTIYATRSLWLNSHPVYSPLLAAGAGRWARFVCNMRVRPRSYNVQFSASGGSAHLRGDLQIGPDFVTAALTSYCLSILYRS